MLLITDALDACRPLLDEPSAWEPFAEALVDADARRSWDAFGAAGDAWVGRSGARPAPGRERLVVVLADAPRSQFDHMNELLAAGEPLPDGFACVALAGSRFHGQRGRAWTALRGNLHLSLHLTLDLDAARHAVGLTVLPAVATARAIERLTDGRLTPRLKWVNDVWLDGRKVGGVLTATQVHAGRLRHAVLGIGVNVAQVPDLPASPRAAPATALASHDAEVSGMAADGWARLLPLVLDEIERARATLVADAGAALLADYRARAAFLGRQVTIWPVDDGAAGVPSARGRVLALNDDLSLVLEGHPAPVHSGRMTLD